MAGLASAADKDDRPAGRAAVVAVPRYYVYRAPYWGWNRWGWGPRYGDPFWNPYPGYYYYTPDTTGKVKIHDSVKTDTVFLNGAFAGSAHDLKSLKLNPGNYQLEVRREGRNILDSTLYVVTGKTVHIDVDKAS